ncbi:MAG: tRNA lysidine(34) synthetase TilS [Bacteriovoracaceae bacterium]|nr:tRNA lysidine(34) synthetase TilS [Bacteriovoracaceae bacterium]
MKKLSPIAYRALFFKHVWRFIGNVASPHELILDHAVAVSGGLDSMTLLWFANRLHQQGKIGKVRALFVHHHTREGQGQDLAMIESFCKQEGIPLVILHAKGLSPVDSNFEAKARKVRRDLCMKELGANEMMWTGHHLDDSYEWSFMQRHRSTSPKASIGIPVRNKKILRPFLCVSRAQIKRLSVFEGIPYRDDPTNKDTKYDRNFVRLKIVPLIKERYPKYLKFYSHFANFSAMVMKISVMNRSGASELFAYENGAIILGRHFSDIQIQEMLHHYSSADRGEIITPIERMLRAIENGKKGPFHFSGGMEAFYSHNMLMIYRQGMKNEDETIASVLSQLSNNALSQMTSFNKIELEQAWKNLLQNPDAMRNMPGLVLVLESESVCKTLNTSVFDPRYPKVSAICKERGLRFMTIQKCLDVWMQKKEKLPKKLKLLPLYNLSNLFTSQ